MSQVNGRIPSGEQRGFMSRYFWPSFRYVARKTWIPIVLIAHAPGILGANGSDIYSNFSRGLVHTEGGIVRTVTPFYGSESNNGVTIKNLPNAEKSPNGGLEATISKDYIIPADEESLGLLERVMALEIAPMTYDMTDEQYEAQLKNTLGVTIHRVAYDVTNGSRTFGDGTLVGTLTRENAYEALQKALDEGYARGFLTNDDGSLNVSRLTLDDCLRYNGVDDRDSEAGKMIARRFYILNNIATGMLTGEIENPFKPNVLGYQSSNTDAFPQVPQDSCWVLDSGDTACIAESDINMIPGFPAEMNHLYWAIEN